MAEVSAISWTDATFNPWIGCTKVGPGCDHCYAEQLAKRRKWVDGWGPGVPRHRTAQSTWNQPRSWNRKAEKTGNRTRVFCASMADVFDNEVEQSWRDDLWQLIRETPLLRWMLLTKRIGNAPKMLPPDWPFPHAGLMATIVNQQEWDRDFHKLMAVPAAWRGVSAEPLLGHMDIGDAKPDWIITGGESGPNFRPLDMDAVRSLRDQCARNGITFHHKQNGGIRGDEDGCLVDGVEHKFFPPALTDQLPVSSVNDSRLHDIGREIKVRIDKLNQLGGKAVDMFDSISSRMTEAERLCGGDAERFDRFKREYCGGLSRSRMYELLAIQTGTKTEEEIRAAGRLRVAKHRERKKANVTDSESVTPALPTTAPPQVEQAPLEPSADADVSAGESHYEKVIRETKVALAELDKHETSIAFAEEITDFLEDFGTRFESWVTTTDLTDDDAKEMLRKVLMAASDGFKALAQEIDGRSTAQIAEAA